MDNLLLKKVNAFLSHTWNCCLSADLEQPDILFYFTLCLPSNFFLLLFISILSYQACSNSRNVYIVEIQTSHEALTTGDILVLQCYIQVTSVTGRWVFPCLELCFYTSDSQKWLWHCPACVFWKIPASKGKRLLSLTNQYWSRWNICSDPTVQAIQS